MLYSYFKLLLRNLERKPLYVGINVAGLTIGIATAALVASYSWHELQYDRFHPNHESIVRISGKRNDTWFAPLSATHSNVLKDSTVAGISKTARVRRYPNTFLQVNSEKFYEEKVLITDSQSDFFDFFNFPTVEGNLQTALRDPYSIVLTESLAGKMFGNASAIGESIQFDTLQLKVTAVIHDLPSNTHLNFNALITNDRAMSAASGFYTYCMLNNQADVASIRHVLASVPIGANKFDFLQDCRFIPLSDIHFEGNMTFEMKPPGSKMYLLIFMVMGSVVLLLSSANFISLSIVVYTQRAREIAIRKVVGAHRMSIFWQFVYEAVLISALCIPFVLLLLEVTIPIINESAGIRIQNFFAGSIAGIALLLLGTIVVGILSGLYPAVVLPKINALILLRKGISENTRNVQVRTGLVGFQITFMVIALSVSWIVSRQLSYMMNKDLGIEYTGVIKLKGAWQVDSTQYRLLKSQLLLDHSVVSVSQGFVPGDEDYGFPFKVAGSEEIHDDLIAFSSDHDYLKTLGIELLQADFSSTEQMPKRVVLINETLARRLNAADPLGQQIIVSPGKDHERKRVVNGVFRDFHFYSLHQPLVPVMLILNTSNTYISQNVLVKVRSNDPARDLETVTSITRRIVPDVSISVEFMEDDLAQQYQNEKRLSFFSYFLLLITIVLATIGLVGLASYTTQLRTKEIGIRKVFGATLAHVLALIGLPYIRMAIVTFLLGTAISLYLLDQWLESFTYRISISWTVYAIALTGLLVVLLATVGVHSMRAAMVNPVKSLRSE